MFEINVFVKRRKAKDGDVINHYSTKNIDGVYFEVRFTLNCVNRELIPNDKNVFTVVLNSEAVSRGMKSRRYEGNTYTTNILYIRGIEQVKEYIEPEFDCSDFVDGGEVTSEPLPF